MSSDVTVIILTFNEAENIAQALDSVCGWAKQVLVLDSFSTDATLEIAARYDCEVFQHRFQNFGAQRNHALDALPIRGEWVFFLDADEWLPEDFKQEVSGVIAARPAQNGFFAKRRFIWMGKWIRRGYYPTWLLRLFRNKKARCEDREVNEHLLVDGEVGYLQTDFIHEDRKSVARWIQKHNDFAAREAAELVRALNESATPHAKLMGTQEQRKRWIRERVWNHLPPLVRPMAYFSYRYVVRGGFLDGRAGLAYHLLQALWFPLLIDLKYLELKAPSKQP